MGGRTKKLYWAGAGTIFLLLLLIALAIIGPRLVDSSWLKNIILKEVHKEIKGEVGVQRVALTILPFPAVSLQQVTVSIPETAEMQFAILQVYPELLPLLSGNLAIAKVVVDEPDFSLPLPEKSGEKAKAGEGFSPAAAIDAVSAKLERVLAAIPDLKVEISDGSLRLLSGGDEVFLFANINGSFATSSQNLTVSLDCRSNIMESMAIEATLTPSARNGGGKISLENITSKSLTRFLRQNIAADAEIAATRLDADFSIDQETGLTADINGSGVTLAPAGKDKEAVQAEKLAGKIRYADKISAVTVKELSFSQPHAELSGAFTLDREAAKTSLDIQSTVMDISGIREAVPALLSTFDLDQSVTGDIFDIVRSGTLTGALFHVDGHNPADLGNFKAMRIQGHFADTAVTIPGPDLDLQGVAGDVVIENGVLAGKNLQAELGNSTGSNGTLKLGLVQKAPTPFFLGLDLTADLSEVVPLLKKLVKKKEVLEYLARIEKIAGTGQGRLTLGDSLEAVGVKAKVDTINMTLRYKDIPFTIIVDRGIILHDGLQIQNINLQGKVGHSTFSSFSSSLNFAGQPAVKVESGTFQVILDEIFPWLAKQKGLAEKLKDIQSMTGNATVTIKSVQGPLLQPAKLRYDLLCEFRNVTTKALFLPGPLTVKGGTANFMPDKFTFENLQADLLDSSLTYSGVLQGLRTGKPSLEGVFTAAAIGEKLNIWFTEETGFPPEYNFRTPLQVSRASVTWRREELLDLQGDFASSSGPIFSIDMMLAPDSFILRNFALKNGDDRASIKFSLNKQAIGAEFQGSLSTKSIDAILLHNDFFPNAWIRGDMKFHFNKEEPDKSLATGKLDGGDFIFPWPPGKPLQLKNFSLAAANRAITLNAADTVFADMPYSMKGKAEMAGDHIATHLDVRTDTLELDKILGILEKQEKKADEPVKKENKSLDLAVRGDVDLHTRSLVYKNHIWKPFESHITFDNKSFAINVLEAELCRIATPGTITFRDGIINLDFNLAAEDQEFQDVLLCLEGGRQQMTGRLNFKADISGRGTRDTLVESLHGNLLYSSKDGYIYHDAQAAKLLYVLNVTNMFKGKIPDLKTAGFHYDSIIVRGTMDKGILTISPARLDAPIMEIAAHGKIDFPQESVDLTALVAPLQSVNKLQQMIPIISKFIPESLVAVPVEISGDFSDIKVRTLSMSAISRSVFGTMVDALSTPVRMLEDTSKETK